MDSKHGQQARTANQSDNFKMKTSTSASIILSLAAVSLLLAMPAQLGFESGFSNGLNGGSANKLDAQLAELGIQDRIHFDDTDLLPGADRRWAFPMLQAAQLAVGDRMSFVLPGGTSIAMALVERQLLDERSIQFTFSDPAFGNAAEITVREGIVRGVVHATVGGRHFVWSLVTATDANGLTGEYYDDLLDATNDTHESLTLGFDANSKDRGADGNSDGNSAENSDGISDGGIAGGSNCQDSGQIIDVLLAYTPGFAALFAGDTAALQSALTGDIGIASSSMANSNAVPRFRIAGFAPRPNSSTGTLDGDLIALINPNDGWNDGVHATRNAARADLVALYSDAAPAGSVSVIGVGAANGADAFSAVGRTADPQPVNSLARALGANMGCCSQVGLTPPCDGYYNFSHAWTYGSGTANYQTIMASGTGIVIPFYSNPIVSWLGAPTGTSTANNARTASLTAIIVANYRCSSNPLIDCDGDGVPDDQAILSGLVPDCNATGIPDSCDIALGISLDINLDGIPDECPLGDVEFSAAGISALDTLGAAVGMSAKSGDALPLAVIGAPGNDTGASNAGGAYLFTVEAGVPVPIAFLQAGDRLTNAFFGRGATVYKRADSLSNPIITARNFALIGAYRWTETSTVGTFPSKGAIYLFAQQGAIWNQIWRYTPPATNVYQARENSLFGYSVAMGRNPREGSDQIIVGAPGHINGRGKVYLLRNYFPTGQSVERAGLLSTRQSTTPVDGDNYGAAVALEPFLPVASTSRVIAVIGAPGRNLAKGAAYIFDRGPGSSTGIGTFPTTPITLSPTGADALAEGDRFGAAVAISGNLIAIGAPGASGGKGRIYFWERSTTTIGAIPSTYTYRGTFNAPDGAEGDAFGSSIGISASVASTGFTIVVGAPTADIQTPGGLRNNAGKVYVLHKTIGLAGAELLSTRASFNPATGDELGYSAASTRGFSLIGAPFSDTTGLNSGKARLLTTP